MFMGTYNHNMDAKGRLIIPADLREELGDAFVLSKSADHCLALYSNEEWGKLKAKFDGLPTFTNGPARNLARLIFGNTSKCTPDSQGRILIKQDLRKYAGLTKEVVLVGVNDHVEIWSQDAWETYNDNMDIDEILGSLGDLSL